MARKTWRGHVFDSNTYAKLVEVDKLAGPNIPVRPTQGSYSNGVAASAGTHAGGGAGDISTRDLTAAEKDVLVFLMRRVGLAAWLRTADEGGWAEHIHFVNPEAKDLSAGAKAQVGAYRRDKSGLKSAKADRHLDLGAPKNATWKSYLGNWSIRKVLGK